MSRSGRRGGRMSECSGPSSGAVILEEAEASGPGGGSGGGGSGGGGGGGEGPGREAARCALWPRQQTWLCVVPLLIGFIGLGLSLMLLKWIVVGSVRDYVPTDLVDPNRIGQDPIFLSKPSGLPKSPETTTTTTTATATATTTTPTAQAGNAAPRTAPPARGRTRSTTAGVPGGGGASGSQVTPRNPLGRNGHGAGGQTTAAVPRSTFRGGGAGPGPTPPRPTLLHDSTQLWNRDARTQTAQTPQTSTPTTRAHGHRKTPSPTLPPLHSEHFKPCHEKDLAYCLNGGECFVIETLSGPHKHCKCREGYQGIRCDQFLPKTDSILSDPNHLGIEFMESKEVYKRQVMSIMSIAMAISLLGALCTALYCRNKRRREKLQVHLKESRSLKNYTANSHHDMDTKTRSLNANLQHDSKRAASPRQSAVGGASLPQCSLRPSGEARANKHECPDQRSRAAHWSALRRTPPIPKGRLNAIGGSKYSGPVYRHLQEVDASERDADALRGRKERHDPRGDAFLHMQTTVSMATTFPSPGPLDVGFRVPSQRPAAAAAWSHSPSLPFRSCSIPIIPSVQCRHDNEAACMQTATTVMSTCGGGPRQEETPPPSSSEPAGAGRQRDQVALLLQEAQEQLRALAHRRQDQGGARGGPAAAAAAPETVSFLHEGGSRGGGEIMCYEPTESHLFVPSQSQRDLGQSGQ